MKVVYLNGEIQAMKKKRITFTFYAPEAKSVHISGSFNDWNVSSDPLSHSKKDRADGTWKKVLYLEPGVYEYRFIVDGIWHDDTSSSAEGWTNEFGTFNCVIWV
jgi:1,4-alpha-glucan branching enzyme